VFRTAEGEAYEPVISGYRHFDGPGIEPR
jgi:hypothetical protein